MDLPGGRGTAGRQANAKAYMLTEALVYIGAVGLLLGVAMVAMHRCIDHSLVLRRTADQITHTMHIGELWRADVRSATRGARVESTPDGEVLHLEKGDGSVDYRYAEGAVYRRVGSGPWSRVLEKVQSSSMRTEVRSQVAAWWWDLELSAQARGAAHASRVRPLFSFLAAAPYKTQQP